MILTPEQKCAVASGHPRMIIAAGPGSGKTRVLVERTKRLLSIGQEATMITFTTKAAEEMRLRTGDDSWCSTSTFHAWCLMVVKRFGGPAARWLSLLTEEDDCNIIMSLVCDSLGLKKLTEKQRWDHDGPAYKQFRKICLRNYLMTFDIVEELALDLFRRDEFCRWMLVTAENLLVDEAQDMTVIEERIVREAMGIGCRVCLVGDGDQSIFGFRPGYAGLDGMMRFANDPSFETHELTVNHRSAPEIVEAARQFGYPVKQTAAGNVAGGRVSLTEYASDAEEVAVIVGEVRRLEPTDVAIIARTNRQLALFRAGLKRAGVAVSATTEAAHIFTTKEDREFLADARRATTGNYAVEALDQYRAKTINAKALADSLGMQGGQARSGRNRMPSNYKVSDLLGTRFSSLSRPAKDWLLGGSYSGKRVSEMLADYAEAVRLADTTEETLGVSLFTPHAAKGKERLHVYVTGVESGVWPTPRATTPKELDEEKRCLYVAVTRAIQFCDLSYTNSRAGYSGEVKRTGRSVLMDLFGSSEDKPKQKGGESN